MYHLLIRSTTPQHQNLPRLSTCTEVSRELRQGQALLREEVLAASKFHNMISKPLTEDPDLAHVFFFSLSCYHQKYSYLFSKTWRNAPGRDPHCRTTIAHGKDSCWRNWWRTVSHGSDPTLEQGKDISPWGGSSGRNIWWTDCSFPIFLCCWQGGGRESEIKLSLRRREGWEDDIFRICFTSHYLTLILIGGKLN